jgi:uncharacterized protein
MDIRIKIGDRSVEADLNDSPTAQKVAAALPLSADFDTWGDEIYFSIPVVAELEQTARQTVEVGDLGYWPTGQAFCIFFGPTPMSTDSAPVAASAVNIIGRVKKDATCFKSVMDERRVTIEAI